MEEWLWKPVASNGIPIGRIVDVIYDDGGKSAVGFEVRCQDGQHRFLPRSAATAGAAEIEIGSTLALLDTDQLDFYRRRGASRGPREEPAA